MGLGRIIARFQPFARRTEKGNSMKIGVLCSGGDAPGMNPCIRAIVRAGAQSVGVDYRDEIVGIYHGYRGLLNEEFLPLGAREVSGLTSRGGSILYSSRCKEFEAPEGRAKAAEILKRNKFDALITIGGNGTLSGARDLGEVWDGKIIGVPGTIDNDLLGTDMTIGFQTAVQTGVEAVDKLRDTAGSHDMMFIVEVMGRLCGDLAAYIALAAGCELAEIREIPTNIDAIVEKLKTFKEKGKRSIIMTVAEGDDYGGAYEILNGLKAAGSPYEMRAVVLGHVQRGGVPCPGDRILATKLGISAVDAVHLGETGKMIGEVNGKLVLTPFKDVVVGRREGPMDVMTLIDRVSV